MAETEIEIPTKGGVRGRIERLAQEYLMRARALTITAEILDEDDRKTALQAAPKKFLQAINHRNGTEPVRRKRKTPMKLPRAERDVQVRAFLQEHPGALTNEIAVGLGVAKSSVHRLVQFVGAIQSPRQPGDGAQVRWVLPDAAGAAPVVSARNQYRRKLRQKPKAPIHGKAMTLYMLEHLAENRPTTPVMLVNGLALAGSPISTPKIINGIMGAIGTGGNKPGWVKKKDDGYYLTPKGAKHMVTLRKLLEASGKVPPDGYIP